MLFADGDDDDFMPLDDGGSSDSDSADAAAPGTASYYKARLHEPVHPSTDVTLWQCLYALLSEKRSGQIRDKPFENHLWYLHNCLLPRYACDPRFLPHQKKKIRFISDPCTYDVHQCITLSTSRHAGGTSYRRHCTWLSALSAYHCWRNSSAKLAPTPAW